MSTLRELTSDLIEVNALAEDPEITPEMLADTIDGLEGMFNDKAINVVHVIANSDSDIAEIDSEIARLSARKKVMTNGKDRLKEYLRMNMEASEIKKIEHPLFTITLAAGRDKCEIEDPVMLPTNYTVTKTTVNPDKIKILADLKEGVEIPGAFMGKSLSSIRIK